jgi:translocation and assembly module TamB
MRRAAKAFGIVVVVLIIGIAALYGVANTGWGMRLLASEVPALTGGQLEIGGLSGRFPDRMRIAHGVMRDKAGVWARFSDLNLIWDPLALLHGDAQVETLTVGEITVSRLPQFEASGGGGGGWPRRIDVDQWRIDKVTLAASLAKVPATLDVTGSAHLSAQGALRGQAVAHRLDGAGDYRVEIDATQSGVAARLVMTEPAHGLIARLAGLPELGAIDVTADIDGSRDAERLELNARAGALRATAQGTLNLLTDTAYLAASATAPAMAPRPDLGWRSIRASLTFTGEFAKPTIGGKLRIDEPRINGVSAQAVALTAQGNEGAVHIKGNIAGLIVPGRKPDLFATAPVAFAADARLDTSPRTIEVTLRHPLVVAAAKAAIKSPHDVNGTMTATLPRLAPLATLLGLTVDGSGTVDVRFSRDRATTKLSSTGAISITGGQKPLASLVGDKGRFDLSASLAGSRVNITRAELNGAGVKVSLSGSDQHGSLDLAWQAALPDLARISPTLRGALTASGRLAGPADDLGLTASLRGDLGGARIARGPIAVTLDAHGLPKAPQGRLTAQGTIDGAPLRVDVTARRSDDGTIRIAIDHATWKGTTAAGNLALPIGARWPEGRVDLRLVLADFARLSGTKVAGAVAARLDFAGSAASPRLKVAATGRGIALPDLGVGEARLSGTVADLFATAPKVSLDLKFDGIDLGEVGGDADIAASGPINALALRWSSHWRRTVPNALTAQASGSAVLDTKAKALRLAALEFSAQGETARLLAPARLDFAHGIAIDRLRIGAKSAVLEVRGRFSPRLDATIALRNVTPALAGAFVPGFKGAGSLRLDARLEGTLAAPRGTVRVEGQGLAVETGEGAALPPARIEATALLDGSSARLDARLTGGRSARLAVTGSVPLQPSRPFDLRAKGTVDLAMLDPLIAAEGRTMRGNLTINGRVGGTLEKPSIDGSATIAKGDFQDYVQGAHLRGIAARFQAANGILHIVQFTGQAGAGTIGVSGTVDMTQAAMPVDIKITARHASPVQSDILSADINASLTVKGQVHGRLAVAGNVFVNRANITVPDKFPTEVAVLKVRRPGQKPTPRRALPAINPSLAVTINAPEQVFVRGHGLDAELGGTIRIGGTAENPQITGALSLRRGTFDLVGQTLNFTSGSVTFDQASLKGKIDPAIHFVAQSSANNVTATLTVTGYADAPVVKLTSSPSLPADQIMAQLLFGQNVTQLNPLQLASVAQGVASLGGIGGSGSTLGEIRSALGLDRLSVGSDTKGTGAAIEAGRYVARGVYVGAKQGVSGGTQAQVQVDLTKHLKAQTTLGYGNGAPVTGITPQNDPGSSVGITYQFEY